MAKLRRPCIVPDCPNTTTTSRCPTHTLHYPHAERQRMANAVTQWVHTHGYHCPGYQVPPHPSQDLTADHVIARANNGNGTTLTVLCRACNARKGTRNPNT